MTISPAASVTDITAFRDDLTSMAAADTQAEAVDRIQELERLKAACEAAQARETAALEELRLQEEAERDVPEDRRGKGLGSEIGLARAESPARGSQHLRLARTLVDDLPHTFAALQDGRIREEHAQAVVTETAWLSSSQRREVDTLLIDRFGQIGPRKLGAEARAHAQRLDPAGAVERLAQAANDRCVSVRPQPEGMARVSLLTTLQKAVGVVATLRRDATTMVGTGETADPADPNETPRTRDQIMADLAVERITGQTSAAAVPAEVQVVMSMESLMNVDETPAWLSGYGPIPADTARKWLANEETAVFLRRAFTKPTTNQLVNMESKARDFPPGLRKMVKMRDDICRTPYCEAPIRDVDHIRPVHDGGTTTWQNASGLCAGCNQTKENTGWQHHGNPEFLRVTTPTGHHYTVSTPEVLPGRDTGPPRKKKPLHKPPDVPLDIGVIDIAWRRFRPAA